MNEMIYLNHTAKVEYDEADKIFVGRIIGIRDVVSFYGSTAARSNLRKSLFRLRKTLGVTL